LFLNSDHKGGSMPLTLAAVRVAAIAVSARWFILQSWDVWEWF